MGGGFAQHVAHAVAPAQAALGDLVQGRRAMGGEQPEQLEGFLGGILPVLGSPAGHPVGDRHGRDRADAPEALLDLRVELALGVGRSLLDQLEHPRRTLAQGGSDQPDLLLDLLSLVVWEAGTGLTSPVRR